MNWARAKSRPRACANDRAARVLPRPGKSSSSTWPLARIGRQHQGQRLALADDGLLDLVEHGAAELGGLLPTGRCRSQLLDPPHASVDLGPAEPRAAARSARRSAPAPAGLVGARVAPSGSPCRCSSRRQHSAASRSRSAVSGTSAVRWLSSTPEVRREAVVRPGCGTTARPLSTSTATARPRRTRPRTARPPPGRPAPAASAGPGRGRSRAGSSTTYSADERRGRDHPVAADGRLTSRHRPPPATSARRGWPRAPPPPRRGAPRSARGRENRASR